MTHYSVGEDLQLVPLLKPGQSFGIRAVKNFGYHAGKATLIPLNSMSIMEKSSITTVLPQIYHFLPRSKSLVTLIKDFVIILEVR